MNHQPCGVRAQWAAPPRGKPASRRRDAPAGPRSGAVVGMAAEDCRGAVELLGEHDAHHLVRPRRRTEGDGEPGDLVEGRVVAVGAADGDDQRALAAVAEGGDPVGEGLRGEVLAALVEEDDLGAVDGEGAEPLAFLALARFRVAGAAFRESRRRRRIRGRARGRCGRTAPDNGPPVPSRGRPSSGPRHVPLFACPAFGRPEEAPVDV
jgi:hypothetical protein